MNFEAGAYNEKEKKRKEAEKKEKEQFLKKQVEHKKLKEYIHTETETEENLHQLHDLVEEGVLTKEQAQHIAEGEQLTSDDVQEIFEKIDQIENIHDVDKYLPDNLRITKEDYTKAMVNDIFRVQTITKLDTALTVIGQNVSPNDAGGVNLFSGFLTVLDKNLIILQENTIDIKNNLKNIEEQKNPKRKLSLWSGFIKTLKDILK